MSATLKEIESCQHPSCVPAWDEEKAKTMSGAEIRKTYPRFMGYCPDCRQHVIVYASYMQYIAGDY